MTTRSWQPNAERSGVLPCEGQLEERLSMVERLLAMRNILRRLDAVR